MYSFPVAAMTNYDTLSGFNNTNLCSHHSGSQESEISATGLKSRCHRAALPPHSRAAVPNLFWCQEPVSCSPVFPWTIGKGWFGDDSNTLHLLCILFLLLLHQFHLRSSGIKSWKLGTPALGEKMFLVSSRVLWLLTFLEIMAISLPCLFPWVHRSFFSLCVRFLFLLLIRTLVVALRAHLDNSEYSLILSSLTSSHLQRASFQITLLNSRDILGLHCQSKMKVLVVQSCPTLCGPMDSGPPGSSVHGILQGRILEWVAIPFPRISSQPRAQTQVSCISGRFFTI